MHDCATKGHVMVDDDILRECLVCGSPLEVTDRVSVHVVRASHLTAMGELADPRDTATPGTW